MTLLELTLETAIKEAGEFGDVRLLREDAECLLAMLKEQEKKRIALPKKHVITWSRNDEFSMGALYEAICETLVNEGELFISQRGNREKIVFEVYVVDGQQPAEYLRQPDTGASHQKHV